MNHRGQGLGRALFRDSALRVIRVINALGIRGLIVHPLSDGAKAFHPRLGLDGSPLDSLTLIVTIADLLAAVHECAVVCKRKMKRTLGGDVWA